MADHTILDEAADALAAYDRNECGYDLFEGCAEYAVPAAAVVLRVVEKRLRGLAEQYRQAGPKQRTLGAQWSATKQSTEWDFVADLIAKGLPAETETTDAR
jgi:hypothetical protein